MPFKYDLAVGKGNNRYDGQEFWFRVASKAPGVSEGVAWGITVEDCEKDGNSAFTMSV